MQPGLAGGFAEWSATLTPASIPEAVRQAARRAIVDTLGVVAAGALHPAVAAAHTAFGEASGSCTLTGGGAANANSAALINGTAAHAWDFDDTSYTGIMHGSAVLFPSLLAAAQACDAGDEAFLTAFVVGSEVTYTLADITTHGHYFRGWWSTATFGLVGATAAVARLHGLGPERTAHAVALAAAGAGGGKAVLGTDAKPFLVGEAARRALDFARAAQAGIRGPSSAFEDSRGFFALLNAGEHDLSEAETLGRRWRLIDPGLLFKLNPVCSAAQAAIEQTARLVREADVRAGDIERVLCEIPDLVAVSLVYDDPRTPQEAQFSLPFAVACAVRHGAVRLEDLAPAAIREPGTRALMARVASRVADDLSSDDMRRRYPESARVTLTLRDGRRLHGFCGAAYGMPERPLSDRDLLAKFDRCVTYAGCLEGAPEAAHGLLQSLGEAAGKTGLETMAALLASSRDPGA